MCTGAEEVASRRRPDWYAAPPTFRHRVNIEKWMPKLLLTMVAYESCGYEN